MSHQIHSIPESPLQGSPLNRHDDKTPCLRGHLLLQSLMTPLSARRCTVQHRHPSPSRVHAVFPVSPSPVPLLLQRSGPVTTRSPLCCFRPCLLWKGRRVWTLLDSTPFGLWTRYPNYAPPITSRAKDTTRRVSKRARKRYSPR